MTDFTLLFDELLSDLWGTGSLDDKRGMPDADLGPWSISMLLVRLLDTASGAGKEQDLSYSVDP